MEIEDLPPDPVSVVVDQRTREGDIIARDVLCEPHARDLAARLKARWPERWEASASTWSKGRRFVTTIRVRPLDAPCDFCREEAESAARRVS